MTAVEGPPVTPSEFGRMCALARLHALRAHKLERARVRLSTDRAW